MRSLVDYPGLVQAINIVLSAAATLCCFAVFVYVWPRQKLAGAQWFMGAITASAVVTFSSVFEAGAGFNLGAFITWAKVEYIGLSFLPFLWFGFALAISGRAHLLTPVVRLALAAPAVGTLALVLTNEVHGLIWQEAKFTSLQGVPVFTPTYGAFFWVYVLYSYSLFLAGTVVLLHKSASTWRVYRTQAFFTLIATILPWLSNLLVIFDEINPLAEFRFQPVLLAAAMVSFMVGIFRSGLLEYMPLAYDHLFNTVPDGVVVVDHRDRILTLNKEMLPFARQDMPDPFGHTLTDVFPQYADFIQSVQGFTHHQVHLETGDHTYLVRIMPLEDQKRHQLGRMFVVTDVTLQQRAEKTLQEQEILADTMRDVTRTLTGTLNSEQVLQLLLESMRRIVDVDAAHIMTVNKGGSTAQIHNTTGYPPEVEEGLRRMVFSIRELATLRKAMETRQPFIIPDTTVDPAWQLIEDVHQILSYACAPIFIDDELVGFINLDCFTKNKLQPNIAPRLQIIAQAAATAIRNARLYEQMHQQALELASRTTELERLYEQVRELEQLKSEMIRLAAHDLKNPLNVIISYTAMLTDMPDYIEDVEHIYKTLSECAYRMNDIIQNFLSLERIGSLASDRTARVFDLNVLLERAEKEFKPRAIDLNRTLLFKPTANPLMVNADEMLLYEAVANFVSNALKYTRAGDIVEVLTSMNSANAQLMVIDNGIGIPADQQDRLFSPFFRVSSEATANIEGTGLGLHLTKNIVERQKGRILFQSTEGKGSLFGFEIPLAPPSSS